MDVSIHLQRMVRYNFTNTKFMTVKIYIKCSNLTLLFHQISLNLSNSFIDDEMLTLMLPYWGPLIHALSLEGTFVTEKVKLFVDRILYMF